MCFRNIIINSLIIKATILSNACIKQYSQITIATEAVIKKVIAIVSVAKRPQTCQFCSYTKQRPIITGCSEFTYLFECMDYLLFTYSMLSVT